VQVLRVVDARGRTFEHLFVMGLNRDLFPRGISEDPLLPDAIRAALERDVLPDIPIKRRGFDEERYLFAGLLSASPRSRSAGRQ
jgi:inactivated superfamily I helicase